MDTLILAAGLGSRLSKYTHDIIPKYLINLDNNTGFYYLITYWSKYSNRIFLVIHSKYVGITTYYIKNMLNEYLDKIKIISYDTSDGTAFTLNYILNNKLKDENINNLLLTWCDLYPTQEIEFYKLKGNYNMNNNIFVFTQGDKCRYKLDENNKIIKCDNNDGNIVGIYYFHNYKNFILDDDCYNNDIVNYLGKIGNIYNFELNNIIDYGDEEKILYILNNNCKSNNKFNCRYFNNISLLDDNKLFKKGINDKGMEIIKFEKNWYEYINHLQNKDILYNLIPKIYNIFDYGFIMEYKENYIPAYQYFIKNELDKNNNNNIKNLILDNIIKKLDIIHKIEKKNISKAVFFNNLKKEIYDKIIDRKNIIKNFIEYFGNIEYVNDLKIDTFDNILMKCKNILVQYYEALDLFEYSIILGDCQFSNILIDQKDINNIVFIDPRGYFGNSLIHGPSDYDYAKVLYGISGYDQFNIEYFNIKNIDIDNKHILFDINPIKYDKKIINKYFNKVHKAYLVIIWLSLAEYNKNNIWKCLASYYYGLYLGTLL